MPIDVKDKIRREDEIDIVFQEGEQWFFLDETWQKVGPFEHSIQARWELRRYAYKINNDVEYPSYNELKSIIDDFVWDCIISEVRNAR